MHTKACIRVVAAELTRALTPLPMGRTQIRNPEVKIIGSPVKSHSSGTHPRSSGKYEGIFQLLTSVHALCLLMLSADVEGNGLQGPKWGITQGRYVIPVCVRSYSNTLDFRDVPRSWRTLCFRDRGRNVPGERMRASSKICEESCYGTSNNTYSLSSLCIMLEPCERSLNELGHSATFGNVKWLEFSCELG